MIARFVIALMFLNAATPIAGYAQRRLPSLSRRSAVTAPGTSAAVDYPLTTVLTRDSQMSDTVDQRAELTAPWILGVEASIVFVSAAGYFARAAGFEPGRGAKEVGKGLLYTGLGALLILPLGVTYYPDDKGWRMFGTVCAAAILAGGYNLYLAKQDPTAAEVFRANMIALNAAAVTTWLVARRLHLLR